MRIGRQHRYTLALLLGLTASVVKGQNSSAVDGNGTLVDEDVATNVPTVTPTEPPTGPGGCYYSLDVIYELLSNDDLVFQQKRFVICPGTVMNIGFLIPGVGIDQGQVPLIPRSNTEFLCGDDGKSENECIIKGGDFGLIAVPVFFRQDLSINNIVIRGFTFEGQVQYAGFFSIEGDVLFEDCIFRDSANFGPLVFNYNAGEETTSRMLYDLDEDEEYDPWMATYDYITKYREGKLPRRLTSEAASNEDFEDQNLQPIYGRGLQERGSFEVTIRDCLFTNLQQVERKLGVEFGVITIKSSDNTVIMEDTTFANNQYGNQELTPIGYGILAQGAKLSMSGICFIDNDFRGHGAVLLETTENPFAEGANFLTGNYATDDDNLDCRLAAYFATDEDRRSSNFTCVPVQTDECGGEPVEAPGPAPSADPEETPPEASGAADWPSNVLLAGIVAIGLIVYC